jgi:hypothetical protein
MSRFIWISSTKSTFRMLAAGTPGTGLDTAAETNSPAGNSNQNTLPPFAFVPFGSAQSGLGKYLIVPPISPTIRAAIARPRPVPSTEVVSSNRSKSLNKRSRLAALMPRPVSAISIRSPPGDAPAVRRNSTLPLSVYFTALPSRLSNT